MLLSDVTSLVATAGSAVGILARSYAPILLVPALASSHHLFLRQAWASPLVIVMSGLLLGVGMFAGSLLSLIGPQATSCASEREAVRAGDAKQSRR
jgi:hypothetical protein